MAGGVGWSAAPTERRHVTKEGTWVEELLQEDSSYSGKYRGGDTPQILATGL